MENLELRISGMTCDHCANSISSALNNVQGVIRAAVSYPEQHAYVVAEPGVPADAIIQAIREAGYDAQLQIQPM